jgi:hypothetical protein
MLRIRQQQFDQLTTETLKNFRTRVAKYLREHLPEQTAKLSERELGEKIISWQERAVRYDINTERAIAKWCYMAVVGGDEFDTIPEVESYLKRETPPPAAKVDALMTILRVLLQQEEGKKR